MGFKQFCKDYYKEFENTIKFFITVFILWVVVILILKIKGVLFT